MYQIGDEKTVNNKTYVYIGYGTWEEKSQRNQIIDSNGTAADVKPNAHNSSNELLVNMEGHICSENSSSTPLGANGVFTGAWQDALDYGSVSIGVDADQDSAVDGLVIQWSADASTIHDTDVFTILANRGKNFSFGPARRYVRVVYTNGSTPQTSFNLATALRRVYVKPSSHRIVDNIVTDDDAELVKSVLTGQSPSGSFVNFRATRNGNFKVAVDEYGDTASIDSFSRLRVSNPYTIFDSKQLHDNAPLFWDESLGGSATSVHSSTNARTRLSVTASANDFAIRQTKMRFNYQPGKSQLVLMTLYNEQVIGLTKRVGLFDGTGTNSMTPNNGIFFSTDGDIDWNIAKNGTTTESVVQADWNIDTLDGSGDSDNPSGVILNTNSTQIAIIDFEWLGVGRVRVGFVIDGLIFYCHEFNHANDPSFDSVYMSTPNLPLRYDIQSDGSASGFLDHICSSVMSEGGREDNGIVRYVSTEGTHVDANTENTIYAVLGLRLKSTHIDSTIKILSTAVQIQTGSNKIEWMLIFNPTVAGTFDYSDITNSSLQKATGATANTVTGGIIITGGWAESGGVQSGSAGSADKGIDNALLLGSSIAGVVDTIVLCVRPVGGSTNVDVEGSITWREIQ